MSSEVKASLRLQTSVKLTTTKLSVKLRGPGLPVLELSGPKIELTKPSTTIVFRAPPPVEVHLTTSPALQARVCAQGPAGPSGTGQENVSVPGFTTLGLIPGRMVYASGDYTLSYADATTEASAFALGAFVGLLGRVQVQGGAELSFDPTSPTPAPGGPAYLAAGGRVTASPPGSGFISMVGQVVHVPGAFSVDRLAVVVLRNPTVYKRGG